MGDEVTAPAVDFYLWLRGTVRSSPHFFPPDMKHSVLFVCTTDTPFPEGLAEVHKMYSL